MIYSRIDRHSIIMIFLQISSEVTVGLNSLEGYELYDFVTLNSNDSGVVVLVGTEQLTILNGQGVEKTLRPMEIRGKANNTSMRASAVDNMMNPMRVGDTVTVMEGAHIKKTGTIKHIHKSTVWLHCDTYFKHSGIFPVRARGCALAGASLKTRGNEAMAPPAGRGFGSRAPPKDEKIGKTVKITKGAYKGHLGVVREATDIDYTVELSTKMKHVRVPQSDVLVVGDKNGSLTAQRVDIQQGGFMMGMTGRPVYAESPGYGLGGNTPHQASGSETPMHSFGSGTPRGNETGASVYSPHPGFESPYGGTTPRGGDGASKGIDPYEWEKPMLAVINTPDRLGQLVVLHGKVNPVRCLTFQFLISIFL